MNIKFSLDHVGIAVHSLEEGKQFYMNLGLDKMSIEEVDSEKVRVGLLPLENDCKIELIEPTSEDSPIAKFLEKRGPGLQQLCLRVNDLDQVISQLKKKNIQLINDEPKIGASGCRVVFVHPKATGGVLIELSEPPQGGL